LLANADATAEMKEEAIKSLDLRSFGGQWFTAKEVQAHEEAGRAIQAALAKWRQRRDVASARPQNSCAAGKRPLGCRIEDNVINLGSYRDRNYPNHLSVKISEAPSDRRPLLPLLRANRLHPGAGQLDRDALASC